MDGLSIGLTGYKDGTSYLQAGGGGITCMCVCVCVCSHPIPSVNAGCDGSGKKVLVSEELSEV